MALNIKNEQVERLAAEVATLTGENKTQAIRKALEERRSRLSFQVVRRERSSELRRFLEREIWAEVPRRLLGKPLSRAEENRILGYGARGV